MLHTSRLFSGLLPFRFRAHPLLSSALRLGQQMQMLIRLLLLLLPLRNCHGRRSHMKAVGCQLVYHDTQDPYQEIGPRCLHWAPDSSAVAYTFFDEAVIHYIASGASHTVQLDCGAYPVPCFAPDACHLLCCGQSEDMRTGAVFVALQKPPTASDAQTLAHPGCARHVAWSRDWVAIFFMEQQAGVLALYTVTEGPGLQPLHQLDTSAVLEDISFSPCGSFLAMLDMGSEVTVSTSAPMLIVVPKNEAVVLHLSSLGVRRFGSRKHSDKPDINKYGTPVYQEAYHVQWPGRAMLSWQGTRLLAYGPGMMSRQRLTNRHESMLTSEQPGKHVAMPCSCLDLG